jgi:hypothetical protein
LVRTSVSPSWLGTAVEIAIDLAGSVFRKLFKLLARDIVHVGGDQLPDRTIIDGRAGIRGWFEFVREGVF